jgi:hypothetical protein
MCTEEDRKIEHAREIRDEPMHEWIRYNKDSLVNDYCEEHDIDFNAFKQQILDDIQNSFIELQEDDFDVFCKKMFLKEI